jgi:hypothetical protein
MQKRSYIPMKSTAASEVKADEFKAVYGGFEGTWRINPSLRLILAMEIPFYSWTVLPLQKDSDVVFYKAQAGITWTFDNKPAPEQEYPR